MPRGRLGGKARRVEMQALRYEQLCRETREQRRTFRAREAALALRQSTPDWVELSARLKRTQLEAEMDAMEACLEAQTPDIPILNFDLMPGFEPPPKSKSEQVEPEEHPKEHPDVAEARRIDEARAAHDASIASNQNSPPPPGGKNWKYDSIAGGYDPKDDWRNYE